MWLRVRIGGYKIFTAAANADANKSLKGGYCGFGISFLIGYISFINN